MREGLACELSSVPEALRFVLRREDGGEGRWGELVNMAAEGRLRRCTLRSPREDARGCGWMDARREEGDQDGWLERGPGRRQGGGCPKSEGP